MTNQNQTRPFSRPKTLVRAARFGLKSYVRDRNLRTILQISKLPKEGDAHIALGHQEAEMNSARTSGALSYSIQDHIAVLTALLAEMALFQRAQDGRA